jgi:hypothetical protein
MRTVGAASLFVLTLFLHCLHDSSQTNAMRQPLTAGLSSMRDGDGGSSHGGVVLSPWAAEPDKEFCWAF